MDRLPPGQYVPRGWPVLHYGRVPAFDQAAWDFTVWGATADGQTRSWDWAGFGELPRTEVDGRLPLRHEVLGLRQHLDGGGRPRCCSSWCRRRRRSPT